MNYIFTVGTILSSCKFFFVYYNCNCFTILTLHLPSLQIQPPSTVLPNTVPHLPLLQIQLLIYCTPKANTALHLPYSHIQSLILCIPKYSPHLLYSQIHPSIYYTFKYSSPTAVPFKYRPPSTVLPNTALHLPYSQIQSPILCIPKYSPPSTVLPNTAHHLLYAQAPNTALHLHPSFFPPSYILHPQR